VRLPVSRAVLPGSAAPESAVESEQKALRVLESLMPVLDAIEAGLESGRGQLDHLDDAQARALLAAWLDGQRLLRERILSLFEREGIRPIDALGQRFDPFRHVAVERIFDPLRVPGIIVSERRRGYEVSGRVLRFAEVLVTTDRPEDGQ
jgi:molecular chaperone GrpE